MEKEKYLISNVPKTKTKERLQLKSQLIAFKCPLKEKGAIGIFEHLVCVRIPYRSVQE